MIKTILPNGRYSSAKIHNSTVYLCGQLSTDLELNISEQAENTFKQIDELLSKCGTDKTKILSILVHIKDITNHYSAFNEVYDAWISGNSSPVRTCIEAKMFSEKCLVELTVIAAI